MIRINFILMVLICCLSLSACADSTKQSVNDGKKVTEATPEPTMDPISAEENVINSFYDTMYEVRNDLKKYTYSTVAEETEKLKEPFNELKKQKKIPVVFIIRQDTQKRNWMEIRKKLNSFR